MRSSSCHPFLRLDGLGGVSAPFIRDEPLSNSASRRRRGRELVLRVLFEIDDTTKDFVPVLDYQGDELAAPDDVRVFARRLVQAYQDHRGDVDLVIAESSDNWKFEDIGKVERALLRMATAEILYQSDVPVPVSIDEAVELAKIYAADGSSAFVNGVLSKVSESAPHESALAPDVREADDD
jgi:transcription antitermination protein NusB